MASPMTATQIVTQLNRWGVKYKTTVGWETHNRNHKGPWGPVYGFVWHHTGSDSKDQVPYLRDGNNNLPGPLCHFGIAQDGTCWLIGWGRANHAGRGDNDVLKAVIAENKLPIDDELDADGNTHFYGMEIWYSGSHKMTEEQYYTAILVSCAINEFHGWHSGSEIGHGEWQPGKWDPGYKPGTMMDMNQARSDIAARQKLGYKGVASPSKDLVQPAVKPPVYKEVWETDAMQEPFFKEGDDNPYWRPDTVLRYAAQQAADANRKLDKIMKHLGLD